MFWKLLNTILPHVGHHGIQYNYFLGIHVVRRSQFNLKILANCISINIPQSEFRGLEIQTLVYLNLKCKMLHKYWSSMQLHIQFLILGHSFCNRIRILCPNCMSNNIPRSKFRCLENQTLMYYVNVKCKMLPKYWSQITIEYTITYFGHSSSNRIRI